MSRGQGLLSLQRTAGNRAVQRLLGGEVQLQRTKTIDEDVIVKGNLDVSGRMVADESMDTPLLRGDTLIVRGRHFGPAPKRLGKTITVRAPV